MIALFAVAAIVMTWPLLPQARTHIVDVGVDDTLLYARYARCFRDWLLGREHGYLSFDMYFPSLLSGATDDAALGIAVQALPLAIFIRDYLFTVNLITLASFVMCAHATYLLVRQLTAIKGEGSRGAGIVAGLAFAFCFYRMRQLDHPHVMQMQWLPYALYFLHRLADAPTRKNGFLFTLFLFFACTASFNIAIYSAFVFPPLAAWLIITAKNKRFAFIGWLLIAGAAVGISLLFVYRPFLILRDAGGPLRETWEIKMFSSKLESFHAAPAFSKNYGDLSNDMHEEAATFLGWVVLALASVGLFGARPGEPSPFSSRREWLLLPFGFARSAALLAALLLFGFFALIDDVARLIFFTGIAAAIAVALLRRLARPTRERPSVAPIYVGIGMVYAALCFGLEIASRTQVFGPGIWSKIQTLPGFEQVRTPSRFFFVSSLCAAVLAGLGAHAVSLVLPGKISRGIWLTLAASAVLWDLRTTTIPTRAMPTIATAPPVYVALASAPKSGAVAEFPVEWNQRQRQYVYYANIHQRPTINGVSGWGMYYFNELEGVGWTSPDSFTSGSKGLDAMRVALIAGLRYVVIHRDSESESDTALYVAGVNELGGHPVGRYGDDDLFELPDPPPSRTPRAEDMELRFKDLTWRVREHREVFLTVSFVNRTADNLYDPRPKHFFAEATSAGVTIGDGDGYLLPPIFTPHGGYQTRWRIKVLPRPRPDWVQVKVTDDDGNVWGTSRMKLPD